MVQDPDSAQFDGMPNSAISTNMVDFILTPDKMPDALFRSPQTKLMLTDNNEKTNDSIFHDILVEIHKYAGIDFRLYKRNTLIRRLEKRMNINNIERLADYYTFLSRNEADKETLKLDFLIGVTSFFRDPDAFEIMQNEVIPALCRDKKDTEPIRIWTPGCSSAKKPTP